MLKIIAFLLICSPILAQTKSEKQVIETERKRFEAMVNKDIEFLEKVFSDKLIYNHADGKIDHKAPFVSSIKDGKRTYKSITLDTIAAQEFKNTVILRGDVNFVRINKNLQETIQKLRYSAVYVRQKRNWQMVSWHSTDISTKK